MLWRNGGISTCPDRLTTSGKPSENREDHELSLEYYVEAAAQENARWN